MRVQRPERVRDPIVLLDKGDSKTTLGRHDLQEGIEVGILVNEAHPPVASIAQPNSARVRREPTRAAIDASRYRSNLPSRSGTLSAP